MGAKRGEVRVVSFVPEVDSELIDTAASGARGRIESVKITPATSPRRLEIVTVFPSERDYSLFQTLVEAGSRPARERAAAQAHRRPHLKAA